MVLRQPRRDVANLPASSAVLSPRQAVRTTCGRSSTSAVGRDLARLGRDLARLGCTHNVRTVIDLGGQGAVLYAAVVLDRGLDVPGDVAEVG